MGDWEIRLRQNSSWNRYRQKAMAYNGRAQLLDTFSFAVPEDRKAELRRRV